MIYASVLIGAASLAFVLAWYTWKRPRMAGSTYFTWLMLAVAEWAFFCALEAVDADPAARIRWSKLAYLGIVSVGPLWLSFAMAYSERVPRLTAKRLGWLWIVPLVVLACTLSNEWHGLVWPSVWPLAEEPGARLLYARGPVFWLNLVYCYALLLAGGFLLVRTVLHSPRLYQQQVAWLLLGVCAPWLGNILYLTGISPPGLDLTPVGFALSGMLISWSMFGLRLFDLVPVAHEEVIARMAHGVLVLDEQFRLVDVNPAAQRLLGITADDIGRFLPAIVPEWPASLWRDPDSEQVDCEIQLDLPRPGKWLEVRRSLLRDHSRRGAGQLLLVQDITIRKRSEERSRLLAITDELTGLLNRRGLFSLAEHHLEAAGKTGRRLWLLFADLDNLKQINDEFGHEAGDRAIVLLAQALRETFECQLLARIGGDEFALLLPADPSCSPAELERQLAENLEFLSKSTHIGFAVAASLGGAVYEPACPVSLEQLLQQADQEMYLHKRNKRLQEAAAECPPLWH